MSTHIQCPICEADIEVPEKAKEGDRITCPNCFAQMGVHKHKGKVVLACAFCKEPVIDPASCDACERRRELKKLVEDGRL